MYRFTFGEVILYGVSPLHKTKYFLDDFISFIRGLSNRVASHSDLITLRRAIRFLLIHVFFIYKLYIVIGVYVNGKKTDFPLF